VGLLNGTRRSWGYEMSYCRAVDPSSGGTRSAQPGQQGHVRKTRPVIPPGNGAPYGGRDAIPACTADTRAGLIREQLVARPARRQMRVFSRYARNVAIAQAANGRRRSRKRKSARGSGGRLHVALTGRVVGLDRERGRAWSQGAAVEYPVNLGRGVPSGHRHQASGIPLRISRQVRQARGGLRAPVRPRLQAE
jgi:hypothetical protein